MLLPRLFLVVCVLTVGLSASAQEWTRFRGPNGTGLSDAATVPTAWKESEVRWNVALPGVGHSSPVLWGDKIFLTSSDDANKQRFVLCLSAKDGALLWKQEFEFSVHKRHNLNSFASATPACDADHVYVAWSTPEEYSLLALDHAGKEVWRANLGPFESQHSCGTSPIVYEDLVVLANDQDGKSSLVALDRKTGETRWTTPRKNKTQSTAYSTPCVFAPPGESPALIFNAGAHGITAINPLNGQPQWEAADLFDKRSVSSPIVAGGLIFGTCGSGGGGNYVVAVSPGSSGNPDAKLAYKIDKSAPYVPTPIAKGNLLFLWSDQGVVTCLNPANGSLHWQKRVGGNFFGSPICVQDRLYCISTTGDVVVLRASETFEDLALNPLGEGSHSTPAVADGVLYLRTFSRLIAVGGK